MRKLAPQSDRGQGSAPNTARSSDRALQLLKVVAGATGGVTLSAAADQVGLAPSTALRQLRSLEGAGLVARGSDQMFRHGPELVRIAHQVVGTDPLVATAQPLLEEVARACGETAYLARRDGPESAIYVATAPGIRRLRHTGWLGRHIPLENTAVGAALGGDIDDSGAAFRAAGVEEGVAAVSAPVFGHDHTVVAAVSVVGPASRLESPARAQATAAVVSAATALSRSLGH